MKYFFYLLLLLLFFPLLVFIYYIVVFHHSTLGGYTLQLRNSGKNGNKLLIRFGLAPNILRARPSWSSPEVPRSGHLDYQLPDPRSWKKATV